jgi:hypothetical protein
MKGNQSHQSIKQADKCKQNKTKQSKPNEQPKKGRKGKRKEGKKEGKTNTNTNIALYKKKPPLPN